LWAGATRVLNSAASLRQVSVLCACCLLPYSVITSADLDYNNKLLAVGKKEKLEWVTPKISLMGAADSEGKDFRDCEAANSPNTEYGGGACRLSRGEGDLLDHLGINPPTPTKPNNTNGSAKTLFNGLEH
jgi:hypothetical protein